MKWLVRRYANRHGHAYWTVWKRSDHSGWDYHHSVRTFEELWT